MKKKIFFHFSANYFYNFKDVYDFTTVDADNNIELLKEQAENILK